MTIRDAAVAGTFYPAKESALSKALELFFSEAEKKRPKRNAADVVVAPHAGYAYSGRIAARAFCELVKADTYIILSPNHTGLGRPVSVFPKGAWKTPLGSIDVDDALCSGIAGELGIERDCLAHIREHAIEVQLPFLQHRFGKFKIAPVSIAERGFRDLERISAALASASAAAEKRGGAVALIASSDFSHFVPEEKARSDDLRAISHVEKLDSSGFYNEVIGKNLSICGFAPIVAALGYAKARGCSRAELIEYGTSAPETGDTASVVGYAAIAFR